MYMQCIYYSYKGVGLLHLDSLDVCQKIIITLGHNVL